MKKIRVLIVDDHTLVREGICALLALVADIEVVGEAANGFLTVVPISAICNYSANDPGAPLQGYK